MGLSHLLKSGFHIDHTKCLITFMQSLITLVYLMRITLNLSTYFPNTPRTYIEWEKLKIAGKSKIEKVPRVIRGEKSNKDMASSRNLVWREKGRDLTQSHDKSPYTNRNVKRAKWQQKQRHKKVRLHSGCGPT